MRDQALLVTALALLVIGSVGLAVLYAGVLPLGGSSTGTPAERGAWIFNTGTDPSGRAIPYSGGSMMRASCAGCHGADGRGLRTPMFVSPNITYRNLTDPAGMQEPDGERGMTYTDALIRRAVTEGIDAEGKSLAWPMPRWQLTDAEWSDLLAYLKTLP
jgi:mono/diheme cytochrome c family protein